jgi:hypothetical protein
VIGVARFPLTMRDYSEEVVGLDLSRTGANFRRTFEDADRKRMDGAPIMRLPSTAHASRPWRTHGLTRDFRPCDVWAVAAPRPNHG